MPDASKTRPTGLSQQGRLSDRKVADLLAVLEISRRLGATIELQLLLGYIEQAILQVIDCERATVFLYDRRADELVSRVATGVNEIRLPVSRGIAGEVARTGAVINVPDAYVDPRFNPEIDRKTGFKTQNMLTFPLLGVDNLTVGVLQVLNKRHGQFDEWDETLVRTFGAQAGVAVQRQLLLDQFAEKQRIEHDLDVARKIQEGLLPKESPRAEGFDIAGWSKPADQTGGDCFDFLLLPNGAIAVTIADATGHGIGPALVIAECRALFRAAMSLTPDVNRVVTLVNQLLCDDLPDDRFVTAFFGLLSPANRTLAFTSAGHGPTLYFHAAAGKFEELAATGVPLGIMGDAPYETMQPITFAAGDMLLLITDGFIEWADPDGEQFGAARVEELLRKNAALPAAEIIQMLYRAVIEFARGSTQKDDLTAVIIRKT